MSGSCLMVLPQHDPAAGSVQETRTRAMACAETECQWRVCVSCNEPASGDRRPQRCVSSTYHLSCVLACHWRCGFTAGLGCLHVWPSDHPAGWFLMCVRVSLLRVLPWSSSLASILHGSCAPSACQQYMILFIFLCTSECCGRTHTLWRCLRRVSCVAVVVPCAAYSGAV